MNGRRFLKKTRNGSKEKAQQLGHMVRRFSITSKSRNESKLTSNCIVKSGFMVKSPPQRKFQFGSWKKRYFVLYDPTTDEKKYGDQNRYLIYYDCKEDEIPIDKINLEDAKVTEGAPVNNNKWVINLETKDRLYYLCPETESDLYTWMEALTSTIEKQKNGEKSKRDSISEWTVPSPRHKEPATEVNNRLRDELYRMKLERHHDPQGSGHISPQEPTFEFDFVQHSNSNKDSGIETGDELNSSMISNNGIKGYDPLPPRPQSGVTDQMVPVPHQSYAGQPDELDEGEDAIYGNLTTESPKIQNGFQQNSLIEEDLYDSPPVCQKQNLNQQQLEEDVIYGCPPSSTNAMKPQSSPIPFAEPETDDIYDCPPSNTRQYKPTETFSSDDIYDCPPTNSRISRYSPKHIPDSFDENTDDIYDAPPSRQTTQKIDSQQDDIYDSPPSNAGLRKQPELSENIINENMQFTEEIYDCPPTTNQKESVDSEEMYDCLPSRPDPRCSQYPAQDEVYNSPPDQLSKASTVDEIYDSPPTTSYTTMNSLKSQLAQSDEVYDSPPTRQTLQSKQALTRDDIYDCPPPSTYTTMTSLNEELNQDEIYDCVPNRSQQQCLTQDDIYDAPPQRTLSETIQMKPLPRTNSESIQLKSLPLEPGMDHLEDDVYDIPPSVNSLQQQEEIYESYQPVNNINQNYEPQAAFNRCREKGTTLPAGYNVVNNNGGAYDAIPECFANKPLPLSPTVQQETASSGGQNDGKAYFEQNGKVFQRFTYR
ncbi:GRB2-associated-binding protein 1-like isoform X2 [Clytia hemisphaerica]|uniref:PH domain-containing protein n=1 Tax=Clytia hemisphaerica TaxID=252671 RepID=A0A7M5UUE0_9CNID